MPLVTVPLVGNDTATPRSRLLTLDIGGRAFPFVAGQAVMVSRAGDVDSRPYSIACSPEYAGASGRLELLIALDAPGAAELAVAPSGTLLDVDGPHGTFVLPEPARDHRLLFVAGGTGIAPLRAMIDHVLRRHASNLVSLLYSARRADEFAFIDELRQHARQGRIELHQTVTRDEREGWQGLRGRIGRREFETVVHEPASTLCFACGPPAMVMEAVTVLKALGVPQAHIKTEQWGK